MVLKMESVMGALPHTSGDLNCFGLAVAAQLRRRYPVHAAKNVAADINCTLKAAENLLDGHLSAKSITRLINAYGVGILLDASAALTGRTLKDFIIEQAEQARLEQARARERELEYTALTKSFAPAPAPEPSGMVGERPERVC